MTRRTKSPHYETFDPTDPAFAVEKPKKQKLTNKHRVKSRDTDEKTSHNAP